MRDAAQSLAALFTTASFRGLGGAFATSDMRALVDDAGLPAFRRPLRLRTLYDRAYEVLRRHYSCEYVFKNAITNEVLLKNHDLDTALLITEFEVGEVRADLAVINGTSTAYEIKTSLDKLERLPKQLEWYSRLFDHTVVVTAPPLRSRVEALVPRHVGITVLSDEGRLRTLRKPLSNKHATDVELIFRSMRDMEVLEICRRLSGQALEPPNTERRAVCWEIFKSLDSTSAHDQMVAQLRKRRLHPAQRALVEAAPYSLKHLSIGTAANVTQYRLMREQLDAVA